MTTDLTDINNTLININNTLPDIFSEINSLLRDILKLNQPVPTYQVSDDSATDTIYNIKRMFDMRRATDLEIFEAVRDMYHTNEPDVELFDHIVRTLETASELAIELFGIVQEYPRPRMTTHDFDKFFGSLSEFALAAKRGGYKPGVGLGLG